ncbi:MULTISPECIES: AraC family ligand binding domain-containing protein, partial [Cellulophaga]|uniref:AraC-like ligand binding domain-containing protein n=1 Tax=Cellulophaga baltica TaxID=76594 RepID=A0A1G7GDZ0_9FLAO
MARTIIENIVIEQYKDQSYFTFCKYTTIRFFEILYFEKGSGVIRINGKTVSYTPNSIFVFVPDDIYIVEADTASTVTTIKFLKSFFRGDVSQNVNLPVNNSRKSFAYILST